MLYVVDKNVTFLIGGDQRHRGNRQQHLDARIDCLELKKERLQVGSHLVDFEVLEFIPLGVELTPHHARCDGKYRAVLAGYPALGQAEREDEYITFQEHPAHRLQMSATLVLNISRACVAVRVNLLAVDVDEATVPALQVPLGRFATTKGLTKQLQ